MYYEQLTKNRLCQIKCTDSYCSTCHTNLPNSINHTEIVNKEKESTRSSWQYLHMFSIFFLLKIFTFGIHVRVAFNSRLRHLIKCLRFKYWVQYHLTSSSGWWDRALPQQVCKWYRSGRSEVTATPEGCAAILRDPNNLEKGINTNLTAQREMSGPAPGIISSTSTSWRPSSWEATLQNKSYLF